MKIVISVPVLGFADSELPEKSERLTKKTKLNGTKEKAAFGNELAETLETSGV